MSERLQCPGAGEVPSLDDEGQFCPLCRRRFAGHRGILPGHQAQEFTPELVDAVVAMFPGNTSLAMVGDAWKDAHERHEVAKAELARLREAATVSVRGGVL